jgi:hypothetical protein
MAYVPPPPGSTVSGQPTPEGVPKQSVHITDLPPEVRKSFLMSMVFFPSLIGAVICVIMFLGWITIFKQKEAVQYAQELGSGDMRRRWTAAREMSEHIKQYGEKENTRIYAPETLTALIQILDNPDLDREVAAWSPSASIKDDQEKGSIRGWAALMLGHIGAVLKDKDKAEEERAYKALLKALEEKEISLFAARGLAYLRDGRAGEALARHVETDPDAGVRWTSAEALGSIGWYLMQQKETLLEADRFREYLRNAWQLENAKAKRDETLLDNLALSLARVKDSAGLERLHALEKNADPIVRDHARRALEILNAPLLPVETAHP